MTINEFESIPFSEQVNYYESQLDKFDFVPYIERAKTVQDIIEDVRAFCYENEPELFHDEIFDDDPFFLYASDEVATYLNKRYKGLYRFSEPEGWEPPIYVYKEKDAWLDEVPRQTQMN